MAYRVAFSVIRRNALDAYNLLIGARHGLVFTCIEQDELVRLPVSHHNYVPVFYLGRAEHHGPKR